MFASWILWQHSFHIRTGWRLQYFERFHKRGSNNIPIVNKCISFRLAGAPHLHLSSDGPRLSVCSARPAPHGAGRAYHRPAAPITGRRLLRRLLTRKSPASAAGYTSGGDDADDSATEVVGCARSERAGCRAQPEAAGNSDRGHDIHAPDTGAGRRRCRFPPF